MGRFGVSRGKEAFVTGEPVYLLYFLVILDLNTLRLVKVPLVEKGPLPLGIRRRVRTRPNSVVYKRIRRCRGARFSRSICLGGACLVRRSGGFPVRGMEVFLGGRRGLGPKVQVLIGKALGEIRNPTGPKNFSDRRFCTYHRVCCFVGGTILRGGATICSNCERLLLRVGRDYERVLGRTTKGSTPIFYTVALKSGRRLSPRARVHCRLTKVVRVLTVDKLRVDVLKVKLCGLLGGVKLKV